MFYQDSDRSLLPVVEYRGSVAVMVIQIDNILIFSVHASTNYKYSSGLQLRGTIESLLGLIWVQSSAWLHFGMIDLSGIHLLPAETDDGGYPCTCDCVPFEVVTCRWTWKFQLRFHTRGSFRRLLKCIGIFAWSTRVWPTTVHNVNYITSMEHEYRNGLAHGPRVKV